MSLQRSITRSGRNNNKEKITKNFSQIWICGYTTHKNKTINFSVKSTTFNRARIPRRDIQIVYMMVDYDKLFLLIPEKNPHQTDDGRNHHDMRERNHSTVRMTVCVYTTTMNKMKYDDLHLIQILFRVFLTMSRQK